MRRRSATRKEESFSNGGSSALKILPSAGVSAISTFIIEKFTQFARNGSSNISFHRHEFDLGCDSNSLADSCIPAAGVAYCLRNFSMVNLSIVGWSLRAGTVANLSAGFQHLHSLRLHDCEMGPRDCSLLSNAMTTNRSIKVLDLSNNRIVGIFSSRNQIYGDHDTSGLAAILSALLRSSTVERFDLSSNYLGGVRCTYTSVNGKKGSTCVVNAAKPDEISKSGFMTASMIEEFLFFNQSVQYLNLNNNEFQNDEIIAQSLLSHMQHHANNCDNKLSSKRRNSLRVVNKKRRRFFDVYDSQDFMSTSLSTEGSPCRSLCGIIPSSSRSDYHDLQYSSFHPPASDLADVSNLCLDPSTGILLGAERCFKLSSLTALDLSSNPTFGNQGLSNFITSYTACNQVNHLKSLNLCNAGLDGKWIGSNGSVGLQCLTDFMCNPLCLITILDISINPLLRDQGVQPLLKGITVNKTLVHLNLSETSLRCRETAGVIAVLLMGNKHLETLNLSGNGIEGIDFGCIAQITRSSRLKNLILGQNRIEGSGLKCFAAMILSSHECPLTHLSLRQNALCGSRSLKTFDPEPVIQIARSLSDDANRTLTSLDLSCCDIGARAAEKLMEAMKYNDTITALDISNCNITSMGGVAVGDALPFVKNLQILHLKENCLGAVGCKALFQGLARNTSLTWLDVSSNYLTGMEVNMNIEFDSTSMEEINDSIGSNTTLEYLDLSDNSIFGLNMHNRLIDNMASDGVEHLTQAIRCNAAIGGRLTTLNVTRNVMNLACSQAWVNSNEGQYDGSDESHLRAIAEFEEFQTNQINCVLTLIKAARAHPHLQSLCGLPAYSSYRTTSCPYSYTSPTPIPSTRLCLAGQAVDDLMILLIAFDIAHNHFIVSLDLEHNYIMAGGKLALVQALATNVTLRYVLLDRQRDPLPPSTIYDEQRVRNASINPHVDHIVVDAKHCSFIFRITIAVFVRGTVLGSSVLREVIEFLIGKGPQVGRFLRYRAPRVCVHC